MSKQHSIDDLASGFPTTVSSRFQYVKKLGRGGHGLVYLAFDQQLQRYVALKFFLNAFSQNLKTLFEEARTQAQINNKAICQIFEVIESERGLILVLEYIQGETLHSCFNQYDQHALIRLMHSLATALHEAHQKGVIHRDIKPLNIMVTDSGSNASPVLLDFGLAIADWITTQEDINKDSGSINFKAPEQSSNSSFSLDNRVDIYSLAASFYYCFTSGVPYQESEKTNITLTSHLPADIRLILQKCLHRDPQHRYATAKALADDLARFLACDPVSVRQGTGYRLSRKFFKHKGKALVALMGLTLSVTTIIYNYFSSQILVEKAQAQISYANEINALESTAQLTFMSPLHNIEEVKSGWINKVKQIKEQISRHHPDATSPAYYAIGRIYLELQDYQKALSSLQQAHNADPSPETAFYLAIAYGEVLNQQLLLLKNINNADSRQIKIEALYKAYREPAISLLTANLDNLPYNAYTKALLAYYQNQPERAYQLISRADSLPSWFYRDDTLRGDIALRLAQQAFDEGNLDNAETQIKRAEIAYLQAIEIAPSDPSNRLRLLSGQFLELRVSNQQGIPVDVEFMDSATRLLEQVNVIDSTLYESNLLFGQLAQFYAIHLQYSNGNPLPWFLLSEHYLQQAISQHYNEDTYLALANLYTNHLAYLNKVGLENTHIIDLAVDSFLKINEQHRDYDYFNGLANLYRAKGEATHESDSTGNYQQAIAFYKKASEVSPEKVGSQINAASTLYEMSEDLKAGEKQQYLTEAIALLKKVISQSPNHFVANYYLTVLYTELLELNLYYNIALTVPVAQLNSQLSILLSINNTHPFVRDLELRVKSYLLELNFTNSPDWYSDVEAIIQDRHELYQDFPENSLIIKNYIASLCNLIAMLQVHHIPASSHIVKYAEVLQTTASFDDKSSFHLMLVAFKNWHNLANMPAQEIPLPEDTNDSALFLWAKTLIQVVSHQSSVKTLEQQIESNNSLLPVYKERLIEIMKKQSRET